MANQNRNRKRSRKVTPGQSVSVNTTGGAVRISQPTGQRSQATAFEKAAVVVDVLAPKPVEGFVGFLKDYAVVGLAIGFIVGQQANAVVKQLVISFLDPFVKVWFGQNLSSRTSTLHHGATPVIIPWGTFVYTFVEFFFVLISIYILVKLFRLDKLQKPKEGETKK